MVQINWTFQALDDLKAIAKYISRDSVRYAKMQVIKIRNRTNVLKSHPSIGKVVLEVELENVRELVEGNYRIIYKVISENQIDILTIHHSARNLAGRNL